MNFWNKYCHFFFTKICNNCKRIQWSSCSQWRSSSCTAPPLFSAAFTLNCLDSCWVFIFTKGLFLLSLVFLTSFENNNFYFVHSLQGFCIQICNHFWLLIISWIDISDNINSFDADSKTTCSIGKKIYCTAPKKENYYKITRW